jgi:hypothetical protein
MRFTMTARFDQAKRPPGAARDPVRPDRTYLDRLEEERVRLAMEVARLTEENEALRGSAEIWIRMYEHQLARANSGEREPLEGASGPMTDG